MNLVTSTTIVLCMLVSCMYLNATVIPYLSIRSQGSCDVRELVAWHNFINKDNARDFYGAFSITPEYTHSWQNYQIAEYFWCDALSRKHDYMIGSCCGNNYPTIDIQGTKTLGRSSNALMAENFYLPTDYKSEVRFDPVIDNVLLDLSLYLGLDNILEGLYVKVWSPLCHTRWSLNMCEKIFDIGSNNYDPGYFSDALTDDFKNPGAYGVARGHMNASFYDYIVKGAAMRQSLNCEYKSLENARIKDGYATKSGFAELTTVLGWNFWRNPDYHGGINFRIVAPTGNRPDGKLLFEPIIGNGHHWALGAGLSAHWCLWHASDEAKDVSFYLEAYATHLFSARQRRTFDLCSKPLSRYMVAAQFNDHAETLYADGTQEPWHTTGVFMPIANITTLPVNVSAAAQGECTFDISYTDCHWQFDIGLNFWGRMCEKISLCPSQQLENLNCCNYALKGDAFMYGFAGRSSMPGNFIIETPAVALSSTQSKATIFRGANNWPFGRPNDTISWNQNPGIDSKKFADLSDGTPLYTREIGPSESPLNYGWLHVLTSQEPHFISSSDLDLSAAQTQGMSSSLFINLGYLFDSRCKISPYINVGTRLEFGTEDEAFCCTSCKEYCCSKSCSSGQCASSTYCSGGQCSPNGCCADVVRAACNHVGCPTCSLSSWSISFQCGFAFE